MTVTAAALRELHRIHQQLAELRDRVERGPKQIRARDANVAQLKAKLDEAREKVQANANGASTASSSTSNRANKSWSTLRVKLNAANSNNEYQAFLEQIAAAEMAGSVLSDEILESMERLDKLRPAVKEAEKNRRRRQSRFGKDPPRSRRLGRLDPRRHHAPRSRTRHRRDSRCRGDFKVDYQRVVRSKGAEGWPRSKTASAAAAASRSRSTCKTS